MQKVSLDTFAILIKIGQSMWNESQQQDYERDLESKVCQWKSILLLLFDNFWAGKQEKRKKIGKNRFDKRCKPRQTIFASNRKRTIKMAKIRMENRRWSVFARKLSMRNAYSFLGSTLEFSGQNWRERAKKLKVIKRKSFCLWNDREKESYRMSLIESDLSRQVRNVEEAIAKKKMITKYRLLRNWTICNTKKLIYIFFKRVQKKNYLWKNS